MVPVLCYFFMWPCAVKRSETCWEAKLAFEAVWPLVSVISTCITTILLSVSLSEVAHHPQSKSLQCQLEAPSTLIMCYSSSSTASVITKQKKSAETAQRVCPSVTHLCKSKQHYMKVQRSQADTRAGLWRLVQRWQVYIARSVLGRENNSIKPK